MALRLPLLLLLPALSAPACQRPHAKLEPVTRQVAVMGTMLELQLAGPSRARALEASESAVRAIEAVEARLSTWRDDSELAALNAASPGTSHTLSSTLQAELARAHYWWAETDGAFDPAVGALVDAWDLRGDGAVPGQQDLTSALAATGFGSWTLDEASAQRPSGAARLEEGGFGKGSGLDAALDVLHELGDVTGTLDLGGQVIVVPHAEPYAFALADPRDRDRPVLELRINHGSFATSGNSEHGIQVGGVSYGHLLDPRTGRPVADFGSITVWAPNGFDADCLSTGLYVMGPDAALAWARTRPGIEVLVVEPDGDGLRARATPGWQGHVHPLTPQLEIEIVGRAPAPQS